MPSFRNVCVIGGGPAGLAAAIAFAQKGLRPTVVDRAVPPIDKACGEGLMPDSIEALERLGVKVPYDVGVRLGGIRFLDAHSSVEADFPNGSGVGVRRAVLHKLLVERAAELGVECIWGAKRVQVSQSSVSVDGRCIPAGFIVGADGEHSRTRRDLGLQDIVRERRRFGFRRHYRISPWSFYTEVYWGQKCQIYVTPVAHDEVCVVGMSRSPRLRLDAALDGFPQLRERLGSASPASSDRGAPSVSRTLRRVCREGAALVGDASGSVDAITGEGLSLSFKEALSLAEALRAGELERYQSEHVALSRRPRVMSALMLTLDSGASFQRRAMAGLASHPKLFETLLGVHVGGRSFSDLFGWRLLHFCRGFLFA